MVNSNLKHLQAQALELSPADRATLARYLLANIDTPKLNVSESSYQRRMRTYVEKSWLLAAKTLTVTRI